MGVTVVKPWTPKYEFQYNLHMSQNTSLIFQPLKNVNSIVGSWAVQKQTVAEFGLRALVCQPLAQDTFPPGSQP